MVDSLIYKSVYFTLEISFFFFRHYRWFHNLRMIVDKIYLIYKLKNNTRHSAATSDKQSCM